MKIKENTDYEDSKKIPPTVQVNFEYENQCELVYRISCIDNSGLGIERIEYLNTNIPPSSITPDIAAKGKYTNYTMPVQILRRFFYWKVTDKAGNISSGVEDTEKIPHILKVSADKPCNVRERNTKEVTIELTYPGVNAQVLPKKYAWVRAGEEPPTEIEDYEDYVGPVTQSSPGKWYLYYFTGDSNGNIRHGVFGPYTFYPNNSEQLPPPEVMVNWVHDEDYQLPVCQLKVLNDSQVKKVLYATSNRSPNTFIPKYIPYKPVEVFERFFYWLIEDIDGNIYYGVEDTEKIQIGLRVTADKSCDIRGRREIIVNLKYSSENSNILFKKCAWSQDGETQPKNSDFKEYIEPVRQSNPGMWYLHYVLSNEDNQVRFGVFGPYLITDKIPLVKVEGKFERNSEDGNDELVISLLCEDSDNFKIRSKKYAISHDVRGYHLSEYNEYIEPIHIDTLPVNHDVWFNWVVEDSFGNKYYGKKSCFEFSKIPPTVQVNFKYKYQGKRVYESALFGLEYSISCIDHSGLGIESIKYATSNRPPIITTQYSKLEYVDYTKPVSVIERFFYWKVRDKAGNVSYGVEDTENISNIVKVIADKPCTMKDRYGGEPSRSETISLMYSSDDIVCRKKYAWVRVGEEPPEIEDYEDYVEPVTQFSSGLWYLYYFGQDNMRNTRYGRFGPYYVDPGAYKPSSCRVNVNLEKDHGCPCPICNLTLIGDGKHDVKALQFTTSNEAVNTFIPKFINYGNPIPVKKRFLYWRIIDRWNNVTYGVVDTEKFQKDLKVVADKSFHTNDSKEITINLTYSSESSNILFKKYAWSKDGEREPEYEDFKDYLGPVTQSYHGKWYLYYAVVNENDELRIGCFGPYVINNNLPVVNVEGKYGKGGLEFELSYEDNDNFRIKSVKYAISTLSNPYKTFDVESYEGPVKLGCWLSQNHNGWFYWKVEDSLGKKYYGKKSFSETQYPMSIKVDKDNERKGTNELSVNIMYSGTYIIKKQYAWSQYSDFCDDGQYKDYIEPVKQVDEGIWYLHYMAENKDGFIQLGRSGPYLIDKTRPRVKANLVYEHGFKIMCSLSCIDDKTRIESIQYAISNRPPNMFMTEYSDYTEPVEAVERYFYWKVTDKAGNVTYGVEDSYKLTNAPKAIADIPFSTTECKEVTVNLTYVGSEFEEVSPLGQHYTWVNSLETFRLNMPVERYTGPITQTEEGVWYLYYFAEDTYGNTRVGRFGPYKVGKKSPKVKVNGEFINNELIVNMLWKDTDSKMKSLKYACIDSINEISDSVFKDYTEPFVCNKDVIAWVAEDYDGNKFQSFVGSKQFPYPIVVTTDNTWSPSTYKDQTVDLIFKYRGTDTSPDPLQKSYVWSKNCEKPLEFEEYQGPVTQSCEGYWYLHYSAADKKGNEKIGYFGPYQIDKTLPIVTANYTDYSSKYRDITIELTYNESNIKKREYQITNNTATPSNWNHYEGEIRLSEQGEHYIHYRAVDYAGNKSIGYFGPYKIDKTAPNMFIDCIAGKEFIANLTVMDLQHLNHKKINITYDSSKLQLIDICTITNKEERTVGDQIEGTDIIVTKLSQGIVQFVFNKDIHENKLWSGFINGIKFKAIKDGKSIIKYSF